MPFSVINPSCAANAGLENIQISLVNIRILAADIGYINSGFTAYIVVRNEHMDKMLTGGPF
jgi:hypothetical protein